MSFNQGPTPVRAECVITGTITDFKSMAEAADNGFSQSGISRAVRGIAKGNIHAGHKWTALAPLRPPKASPYTKKIRALLAQGKTAKEVAALLGCSHSTVNYHQRSMA
ncbi:MAG: helix-turn-helix transcriptional regulator [Aeromonadaceae bacterium]